MATTRQYLAQLRAAARTVGRAMGVDLGRVDKQTRVALLAVLAMVAVVMRALFVAGVLTDAQLRAALDEAIGDVYESEPIEAPPNP